ncbi:MAG: cytochrome c oxidase assembly factor Coa1 family protein [Verrucomicrobiales bacterium]
MKTPLKSALGCGCALLGFAGIAAFAVAIAGFVFSMMKKSEPYQHAIAQVQTDSQAVAFLGEPIEPGWLVTGSINLSGSSGSADLSIPVEGSKASGRINVIASKSGGEWSYSVLRLTADGLAQPLDLRADEEPPERETELLLPEAQ